MEGLQRNVQAFRRTVISRRAREESQPDLVLIQRGSDCVAIGREIVPYNLNAFISKDCEHERVSEAASLGTEEFVDL